jgi:hypothetical protein
MAYFIWAFFVSYKEVIQKPVFRGRPAAGLRTLI